MLVGILIPTTKSSGTTMTLTSGFRHQGQYGHFRSDSHSRNGNHNSCVLSAVFSTNDTWGGCALWCSKYRMSVCPTCGISCCCIGRTSPPALGPGAGEPARLATGAFATDGDNAAVDHALDRLIHTNTLTVLARHTTARHQPAGDRVRRCIWRRRV